MTVDGVSTTNTYTNLTLDEVANWEVKGKITFTAIWKDGFAIQYKEGREEIGVGIFGDFYGDHDHSHDVDGIEGKTLFAHVAPDSPTPAYNGMTFGQPRSIDNKLYSFAGWTYLDYATGQWLTIGQVDLSDIVVTEDRIYYAVWATAGYFIDFEPNFPTQPTYGDVEFKNGGEMDVQGMSFGVEVALAPNRYTANGFEFLGWSTKPVNHDLNTGAAALLFGTAFPANFDDDAVAAALDAWGTELILDKSMFRRLDDGTIAYGATIKLYAVWRVATYDVFIDNGDANSGEVTGDADQIAQKVPYGGGAVTDTITATPYDKHAFKGWDFEVTLDDGTTFNGTVADLSDLPIYGTVKVYANWERTYSLTYAPGTHGVWNVTDEGAHFEGLRAGDTPDTFPEFSAKNGLWTPPYQISLNGELAYHQLPKSNDENYIFDGWQSSDGRFFLTIADAAKALMTEPADGEGITLTATWIYAQVTIKFDPGAGEPVLDEYGNSLLAPKTAVPYTVVTLPSSLSATRTGYTLDGWMLDGVLYPVTYNGGVMVAPRHSVTMIAHWAEQVVTITYHAEATNTTGSGYISGDGGSLHWEPFKPGFVLNGQGEQIAPVRSDTVSQKLLSVTGKAVDWEDGQTVVSDYPLIIKATARTGYHFLYWVDHNNNIVSYESSFVAPQSAAGVWENSEYYAIFAEDEDVKIYYRISDYDKGWLRWSSEELAPATGNPRGTELILLPGFELDHWEDDLGNIVGGPDDKIFFPPRYDTYNNSGYKGQDTYVSHVYTAVVKSAPAVKFKVEHYRQEESGTTFEFVEEATGYYAGPTNGFVAVVKHDDSGRYHLAQLSDTGKVLEGSLFQVLDADGNVIQTAVDFGLQDGEQLLMDDKFLHEGALNWVYDPEVSAQTSRIILTTTAEGEHVVRLYYSLHPSQYARIVYEVQNRLNDGTTEFGNGAYGATDPTYELVAPGALTTGSTAQPAPAGFEFYGWFRSDGTRLTDGATFTYAPTIADLGLEAWEVGRAYTVYAVYRELADVTTYYGVKDGKGGTLSKEVEIYPPVSGAPSGPDITTAPGYIFDHWEDKDGNYILIDGTSIVPSLVTEDTELMTEALHLFKDADGTYYNQDGKTYFAVFRFTKVDVTVEHYRVIEGEIVNAKEDGTLVTGVNKPWIIESLKILAESDIDGTVANPDFGNHGSYEPDWPGFTLDLTWGGTIKTATTMTTSTAPRPMASSTTIGAASPTPRCRSWSRSATSGCCSMAPRPRRRPSRATRLPSSCPPATSGTTAASITCAASSRAMAASSSPCTSSRSTTAPATRSSTGPSMA